MEANVATFVHIPRRSLPAVTRLAAAFNSPLKETIERAITAAHGIKLQPLDLAAGEPYRPIVCAFPPNIADAARTHGAGYIAALVGMLPSPPGTPIYYLHRSVTPNKPRQQRRSETVSMETVTYAAAVRLGLNPPTAEELWAAFGRWRDRTGKGERVLAEKIGMSRGGMRKHFDPATRGVGPKFKIIEQINAEFGIQDDRLTHSHYLAATREYRTNVRVRRDIDAQIKTAQD